MSAITGDEGRAYSNVAESPGAPPGAASEAQEKYALVIKGGGLKGLACIGALKELQRFYKFDSYAGTSAGAIIAALLGAGYTANELEKLLMEKNFSDFTTERFMTLPNLFFYGGLFRGLALTKWVEELLDEKAPSDSRVEFRQLAETHIYACKRDGHLIFSRNRTPKSSVSYAVRCSVAIPFFFTPERHEGLRIFDGGMRFNYPVEKLLADTPGKKFVGLYLGDRKDSGEEIGLIRDVIRSGFEAVDREALTKHESNTIVINPKPISTLDFSLSVEEKIFLVSQGRAAALKFLSDKNPALKKRAEQAQRKAIADKKKAVAVRNERTKRRRRRLVISSAAVVALCFAFFYFFYNQWSLQNCSSEEQNAQRAYSQDPLAVLATQSLINCRNPAGYALEGAQAFHRKEFTVAEKNYATAISLVPWQEQRSNLFSDRWLRWRDNLASIQIELGKYPEAIKTFKELVEAQPLSDVFKWGLAKAYVYQGRTEPKSYGLAIEALISVGDSAGKTAAGRGSILRAAAYAGESVRMDISPERRADARKSGIAQLCKGIEFHTNFWLGVLSGTTPYPNASFREEIQLLQTFRPDAPCLPPSIKN